MNRRRSYLKVLCALLLLLPLCGAISLLVGASGFFTPAAVFRALSNTFIPATTETASPELIQILLQLRMPRVALGMLAGANLALSGLILQTLFMNPLADSYLVGVSSGASLGAVVALYFGFHVGLWGINPVTLCALAGAIAAILVVYSISRKEGLLPTSALLLTGIAVGALAQAATTLVLLHSEGSQLRSTLAWLMGSLAYRDWTYVQTLLPASLLGIIAAWAMTHTLNLLAMGHTSAHHLGVRVEPAKTVLLAIAALLAASAVSVCGLIGFVGLVVPNLARLWVGPNHRLLLPVTVLGGALLLTVSDLLTRIVFSKQELPIGITTGLIGGVFLLRFLPKNPRTLPNPKSS